MATSSELFKRTRNWENLQIATFLDTTGKYEIPKMRPVISLPDLNWIGFNYARSCEPRERAQHGLHFCLDDYQFQRLWADPERYVPMLQDFGAVMSPDFSVYSDFPKAVKIWNVARNPFISGAPSGGREVYMNIKAPSWTPYVVGDKYEAEAVLQPGLKYRITGAHYDNSIAYPRNGGAKKRIIVDVEVIP